jgi:hypothetical protein
VAGAIGPAAFSIESVNIAELGYGFACHLLEPEHDAPLRFRQRPRQGTRSDFVDSLQVMLQSRKPAVSYDIRGARWYQLSTYPGKFANPPFTPGRICDRQDCGRLLGGLFFVLGPLARLARP